MSFTLSLSFSISPSLSLSLSKVRRKLTQFAAWSKSVKAKLQRRFVAKEEGEEDANGAGIAFASVDQSSLDQSINQSFQRSADTPRNNAETIGEIDKTDDAEISAIESRDAAVASAAERQAAFSSPTQLRRRRRPASAVDPARRPLPTLPPMASPQTTPIRRRRRRSSSREDGVGGGGEVEEEEDGDEGVRELLAEGKVWFCYLNRGKNTFLAIFASK